MSKEMNHVRRSVSRRFSSYAAVASLLLSLVSSRTLFAQAIYGSIEGTITDTTGAVIPNATVTVTDVNKGTTSTATSNGAGNYVVDRLIPDVYTVNAAAQGFSPTASSNITVAADTSPQVNLQLSIAAAASQTVTVTGAPPPLQTNSANVSQGLTSQQLQALPNINRNFTSFALLTPGVQRSSFNIAPTENPQGAVAINANGSNYGSLGWLLDGTDNREPVDGIVVINPTLDSLSEMRIITENYAAEFGGAVGGFVIAQTKSGGNKFHGDAFWFRRSGSLEARNPFTQFQPDPVTGKYIPGTLYSQFGGSIGGPIKKDKMFFFLDYQGTRQKQGTSLQENVPTTTVRNTCLSGSGTCDLSQYTTLPLYNPGTGQTYLNGQIPASALSPQARTLLSQLPAPNSGTGTVNNYVGSGSGNNDGDQADLRLDDQVTTDLHAFGRYDYALFRLNGAPIFGAAGGSGFGLGNTTGTDTVQNQSVAAGFDYALNVNLLTDFRFGFLDYHVAENKYDANTTPALAVGIANLNIPGVLDTYGAPTYNFSDSSIGNSALGQGIGNQGCNCPLLESEQVFQFVNNWTKIVGNHSIRFGGDIRYALNLRNASDNNRSGLLTFSSATTQSASAAGSGLGLASFLLGQVAQFQRFDVYSDTAANRQKRLSFFAEDSWRATHKLTLTYGVRWDIIFPETVNAPGNGGFTALTNGVIRVAGIAGIGTNGNAKLDSANLGARVGFAYQARPNTVFRGGYGEMYDDVGFFGTIFGSVMTENLPVVASESTGSSSAVGFAVYTLNTMPPRPAQPTIPANGLIPMMNGISPNIRPNTLLLPRIDQFNLSMQRAFGNKTTFTIAYVGNIAERIYPSETEGFNINVPRLPTTPADLTATDPATECIAGAPCSRNGRRPYYNKFSGVYNGIATQCCNQDLNYEGPSARAYYNALQTTVEKHFANGFQFLANYTWSKATNYGATYFAQDPVVEYAQNDTNRNQVFVFSGIYELPFGDGKMFLNSPNRWENYAVGGWELAGTTTWESGLPFTPTYAECGSDQDIDTNFASPGTSSDCRPNKTSANLPLSTGPFNPVTHSRPYFTPVLPFGLNGSASGPFIRPAFGTIGNIGRNAFRGPSDYFADVTLFKNFSITERVQGQFQFQVFNVFNHVPLGVPSATDARCVDCTEATTGQITNVDNAIYGSGLPYMRQLQFGARFTF
jgi:Carboxypeptidase regulatory-like domain